jgi:hypothetical protein
MTCKKTLCQECATDWDGIFYCSACLAGRRRAAARGAPAAAWILVTLAAAGLFALGPRLLVWSVTLLQRGLR